MTPDTHHTFWDPEKGKYVTILASAVIKPPADDSELRRKSEVVVVGVVSTVAKGFAYLLIAAILFGILVQIVPHLDKPPQWEQSIMDWINRTENSWSSNAPASSTSDAVIRKQNDILEKFLQSGKSPTPAKITRQAH